MHEQKGLLYRGTHACMNKKEGCTEEHAYIFKRTPYRGTCTYMDKRTSVQRNTYIHGQKDLSTEEHTHTWTKGPQYRGTHIYMGKRTSVQRNTHIHEQKDLSTEEHTHTWLRRTAVQRNSYTILPSAIQTYMPKNGIGKGKTDVLGEHWRNHFQ